MYEQQKTINEQLELLNACVSHELRNPLNSIKARNLEKKALYSILKEKVSKETVKKKEILPIL